MVHGVGHPTTDQTSLLIPLCLREDSAPDVALVVSLRESGNYRGTILTMHQAYLDARLICRPGEDWLTARLPRRGARPHHPARQSWPRSMPLAHSIPLTL